MAGSLDSNWRQIARNRLAAAWPELPSAYRRRFPHVTADPSFPPLLAAYLADPDDQARHDRVFERALAIAVTTACRIYVRFAFRWPNAQPEDVIQDAAAGAVQAVRKYADTGTANAVQFHRFIRSFAQHETRDRQRDATPLGHADNRKMLLKRIRKQFVRLNGRLPSRDEAEAQLRTIIINPNIQIGDAPAVDRTRGGQPLRHLDQPSRYRRVSIVSTSQDDNAALAAGGAAGAAAPIPLSLMHREAMEIAAAELDADQREILRRTLDGEGPKVIGAWLGVSERKASKRINAVLWQLRKRADLASALGVEATAELPPMTTAGALPSVKSRPARLVG